MVSGAAAGSQAQPGSEGLAARSSGATWERKAHAWRSLKGRKEAAGNCRNPKVGRLDMEIRRRDTSEEVWRVQAAAWRPMSGAERVAIACELSDNPRRVAAEGVPDRHPEHTEEQVQLAVIRPTIGEELFRQAYPNCDVGS